MTAADLAAPAASWAALAQSIERKLCRLEADLDSGRAEALRLAWPFVDALRGGANASAGERCARLQVMTAQCGGLPPLVEFARPAAQLALRSRAEIHVQLCALAIACRPGVLRCCLDKQARHALRAALGPTLFALNALGRAGRPVSPLVAHWPALRWACIGYRDWCDALAPQAPTVRRIVALSLPEAALDEVMAAPAEPAEHAAAAALELLALQGLAWPL